jgi:hypothetical protein
VLEKQLVIDTINENFPKFQNNSNWLDTLGVEEHDRFFQFIKSKLIIKDLYQNIDLASTLNLGDIGIKLLKKYPKDVIIEAMTEDSICRAINKSSQEQEFGLSITNLIDEL